MSPQIARARVRDCLASLCPGVDLHRIDDDTPLLQHGIISSFQVIELLVRLEDAAGARIEGSRLVAGSFRDIATIARVFLQGESPA